MRELENWPSLHPVASGQECMPGLKAHAAPGHTPGHLVFVLEGEERDAIFTGDAAKNRAELLSRKGEATYDAMTSSASIERIWQLWKRRPGSVLIPGHDLPMTQKEGRIEYIGKRKAALKAWFGEDLETTTLIELTVR
jgi:glyoxylase-like metal-dependent hydrolase (beta-lactamase superfamily II)